MGTDLLQWNLGTHVMCQSIHTQHMPDLFGKTKSSRASVLALLSHEHKVCFPLTVNDGVDGPWEIKALLLVQCSLQAGAICGLERRASEPDHDTDEHMNLNEWNSNLSKIRHRKDVHQPAHCPKGEKKEMGGLGKQRCLHVLPLTYRRTALQRDSGHKVQPSRKSSQEQSLRTLVWAA